MPKPNRYHPYARPSSLSHTSNHSTQPVASPRYPSPPTLQHRTQSLPSITEHVSKPPSPSACTFQSNETVTQPIESYQSMHPSYIQAVTSDGAPLIARSILRSEDGTLFVKMEVVGLPSTVAPSFQENPGLSGMRYYPTRRAQDQHQYEQPAYNTFVPTSDYSNPAIEGMCHDIGTAVGMYPSPPAGSDQDSFEYGHEDISGARRHGEEQSFVPGDIAYTDEDAEGDEDLEYRRLAEQKKLLKNQKRKEARRRGAR